LDRVRKMYQTKTATQEQMERAQLDLVQANVEYQQNILLERATEAIQAATALLPTSRPSNSTLVTLYCIASVPGAENRYEP